VWIIFGTNANGLRDSICLRERERNRGDGARSRKNQGSLERVTRRKSDGIMKRTHDARVGTRNK
jgi:hypothetical protein